MSLYNDDLLFIHIPKTGGAAVKAYLGASIPDMTSKGFPISHIRMQDVERFTGRKPESFQKIIAVIRDPYDQRLSQWLFLRDRYAIGGNHQLDLVAGAHGDLAGFVTDPRADMTKWYQQWVGGDTPTHVLDDYLFWLAIDGELPDNLVTIRHEELEARLPDAVKPWAINSLPRMPRINQNTRRCSTADYYTAIATQAVEYQFRHTIPAWYPAWNDRNKQEGPRRGEFLKLLPKGSMGVEVGVWKGDFSQEILNAVNPARLYLVDPWEKNEDATNLQSTVNTTQGALDEVYQGVRERVSGVPGVVVVRTTSELAASECNASLDWVYIDGIHTFPAVYQDLVAWWPHIKPGGMACGDDCWRAEVLEAARVFAEGTDDASEVEVVQNQFIIRKAENA